MIVDPGTSAGALPAALLPDGADFHTQSLWGCIGWGTPAAFGAALAAPSCRVILVEGDGGHQLTANQIGAMGRYGVNLIILLLNNGIFGVEEIVQANNDRFCTAVGTNADLESALRHTSRYCWDPRWLLHYRLHRSTDFIKPERRKLSMHRLATLGEVRVLGRFK